MQLLRALLRPARRHPRSVMGSNHASFRRRKMPRGETGPTRVGGPRRRAREPHGSTDRGVLCQVAASVSALQRNGEPRTPGGADQRHRPTARTARQPASADGALAATAPAPARTCFRGNRPPARVGNPPARTHPAPARPSASAAIRQRGHPPARPSASAAIRQRGQRRRASAAIHQRARAPDATAPDITAPDAPLPLPMHPPQMHPLPLPMHPLPRQRGQRGVEHALFARGRDDRRFRWTAFGVESSATSSVAQNSARYAAPFALGPAARAFSLCDRIGPEKAPWRGNQELRFRGCTLRR